MLGHLIQDARREKSISVEELATLATVSVGTIRAIEQGRRNPSAIVMKQIMPWVDLVGTWLSISTWKADDGTIYELAPYQGGHKRNVKNEVIQEETLRLHVVKKILEVDVETLEAINQLLK